MNVYNNNILTNLLTLPLASPLPATQLWIISSSGFINALQFRTHFCVFGFYRVIGGKGSKNLIGCTQSCWLVGPISLFACCSYTCVSRLQWKFLQMWCKSEEPWYESYWPVTSSAVNVLWTTLESNMSFAIVAFPVCLTWEIISVNVVTLCLGKEFLADFTRELNPREDKPD